MTSPFTFLSAITENGQDLLKEDPQNEKEFGKSLWTIRRGLSLHPDTVMYGNEMNRRYHAPLQWQFYFLLNSIPKKKRYSKWPKAEKEDKLELVMEYYGYSSEKAKQALAILTPEQLKTIEEKQYTGGKK